MKDQMAPARPVVADRSGDMCERCGMARATDVHHRKLRRHGDHKAANLAHLCHLCHMDVHAHPADSYATGFMVRSVNDPRVVPVRHARFGWVRLKDNGDVEPTSWTAKEKQR